MKTCIYCKKERPPTKEHVVQKTLGGDLTIKSVCDDCNGELSTIDQALSERSTISLSRVGAAPAGASNAQLDGDHFIWIGEVWAEVRLLGKLKPELLPQVHQIAPDKLSFPCRDHESLLKLIAAVARKFASSAPEKIVTKIGPADRATTPRLVLRWRDAPFVRASSQEEASAFIKLLKEKWADIEAQVRGLEKKEPTTAPPQEVHVNQTMNLDDVFRAVAKIAFNFLASAKGAEFVLHNEFDPIRKYIIGTDVQSPESVAEGPLCQGSCRTFRETRRVERTNLWGEKSSTA